MLACGIITLTRACGSAAFMLHRKKLAIDVSKVSQASKAKKGSASQHGQFGHVYDHLNPSQSTEWRLSGNRLQLRTTAFARFETGYRRGTSYHRWSEIPTNARGRAVCGGGYIRRSGIYYAGLRSACKFLLVRNITDATVTFANVSPVRGSRTVFGS